MFVDHYKYKNQYIRSQICPMSIGISGAASVLRLGQKSKHKKPEAELVFYYKTCHDENTKCVLTLHLCLMTALAVFSV